MDNHLFMMEQQIYCGEFFEFMRDFIKAKELPEGFKFETTGKDLLENIIPTQYNTLQLTEEEQKSYYDILEFYTTFTLDITAHATENTMIGEAKY